MAGKIKGITIELNGDATKLERALTDVDKKSRETTSSLRDIEKSLKFNPGNTVLVAQQQKTLQDAISNTKDKLAILREADKQAKQQLESGKLGQEKYDELQREIIKTESQLGNYENKLKSSKDEEARLHDATDKMRLIFEKSGKNVDEFSKLLGTETVEAIKKGEGSSQQMNGALQKLGKELLGTGGDAQKLDKNIKDLESGTPFSKLNNGAEKGKGLFEKLRQGVKDSSKEIKDINNINISIPGLSASIDLFKQLGNSAKNILKSIGGAWKEVDKSLDTIIKKTGATGQTAEGMNDTFHDVYTSMPVDAQAVGDAIGELNTQFSLQGDTLNGATKQLLQFADINNTDVTQATQSAKAAMDQFGLSSQDLGSVLDVVTKTGQDTGVSVDKLFQSVTDGAPSLKDMGLSFGDAVTVMGKMQQSGFDSQKALMGLTKAQRKAHDEGKTLTGVLAEFVSDTNSSARAGKAASTAYELFGTRGGTMMLDAAKAGKLSFDELGNSAEKSAGAVGKTYKATLDPADQAKVAQNQLKDSLAQLATTVQTMLAPAIETISRWLKAIHDWYIKLSPGVQKTIAIIAVIAGSFVLVGGAVTLLMTTVGAFLPILGNLIGLFAGVGKAIGALGGFVAANPIVLLIAAIIGAVILLIKHWDEVKKAATEVAAWVSQKWEELKNAVMAIWDAIGKFISEIWEGIKNAVNNALTAIGGWITGAWTAVQNITTVAWSAISGAITGAWEGIKNGVSSALGAVGGWVSDRWNNIKTNTVSAWNGIGDHISSIWSSIQSVSSNTLSIIGGFFTNSFGRFKNIAAEEWDKIKGIFTAGWDSITGWIRNISIPTPHFSISPPGWHLGDLLKGSIPYLHVDWYAQGAIFARPTIFPTGSGLAGVGEAGPEAVAPISKLMDYVRVAVHDEMGSQRQVNYAMVADLIGDAVARAFVRANVGVYMDKREFGRLIAGMM